MKKTAFIAIDYIIDIMHPEGKIPSCAAQSAQRQVIAKANHILAQAKQQGWLSILVKVGFNANYLAQPKDSPLFGQANQYGALNLDGHGTDFHPELAVDKADLTIIKPRVSAFYATPLEAILRANKIERLVIAGVSTLFTVQSTAREAHDRDYQVVIVEDACAAATLEQHQASIEFLSLIATITTTEQLADLN